jgi:hypothetical protein
MDERYSSLYEDEAIEHGIRMFLKSIAYRVLCIVRLTESATTRQSVLPTANANHFAKS